MKPLLEMSLKTLNELTQVQRTLKDLKPKADFRAFDKGLRETTEKLRPTNVFNEVKNRFGVSCWHVNESESEAMWKLYADRGIAIESTVGRLTKSLPESFQGNKLYVHRVRYADFELSEIEKGHQHYLLAMKRQSFAHEKELRVVMMLPTKGKGVEVECDLDILIEAIHVSPLAHPHIQKDLEKLCKGAIKPLKKQISRSTLFDQPSFETELA